MIRVYGIKNCDTMKKALKWLEVRKIDYAFHDYKKEGADKVVLMAAIKAHGWENVLNRKGTTWRRLSEDVREKMTEKSAQKIAMESPSIIKRPLIVNESKVLLGFDAAEYARTFKK